MFNEYLQDISSITTTASGQRVACCGDFSVKVVHRSGMEFEAQLARLHESRGFRRLGVHDDQHISLHALLVPQVLLEVSLDRKPTIGEFLDKVRAPRTPRSCRSVSTRQEPCFRRWNGTTRPLGLLARRQMVFYMCMSSLAFELSNVSRRVGYGPVLRGWVWGLGATKRVGSRSGEEGQNDCNKPIIYA